MLYFILNQSGAYVVAMSFVALWPERSLTPSRHQFVNNKCRLRCTKDITLSSKISPKGTLRINLNHQERGYPLIKSTHEVSAAASRIVLSQ